MNRMILNNQKLLEYKPSDILARSENIDKTSAEETQQAIPTLSKKSKVEIITGLDLLNMGIKSIPTLVDPIMPKVCLMALIGSSDIGKSTMLLQLSSDIALNEEFLDFKINATHKSTIYVSTEDDQYAISNRLQHLEGSDPDMMKNMRFIFDSNDLVKKLDAALNDQKADLVAIDTFTDIFTGEMNQVNKVRSFMNDYYNLAIKHQCAIIFNHHTGKYTEEKPPSKTNSIGSAGFEGKVRMLMELRQDFSNPSKRHLCIVKGNYLGPEYKASSFELNFDPVTGFKRTGERKEYTELMKPRIFKPTPNKEAKELAVQLHQENKTIREIATELSRQGFNFGKSTIGDWIKAVRPAQMLKEEPDTGQINEGSKAA